MLMMRLLYFKQSVLCVTSVKLSLTFKEATAFLFNLIAIFNCLNPRLFLFKSWCGENVNL